MSHNACSVHSMTYLWHNWNELIQDPFQRFPFVFALQRTRLAHRICQESISESVQQTSLMELHWQAHCNRTWNVRYHPFHHRFLTYETRPMCFQDSSPALFPRIRLHFRILQVPCIQSNDSIGIFPYSWFPLGFPMP